MKTSNLPCFVKEKTQLHMSPVLSNVLLLVLQYKRFIIRIPFPLKWNYCLWPLVLRVIYYLKCYPVPFHFCHATSFALHPCPPPLSAVKNSPQAKAYCQGYHLEQGGLTELESRFFSFSKLKDRQQADIQVVKGFSKNFQSWVFT